jgi:putative phosphoribosyl transferase
MFTGDYSLTPPLLVDRRAAGRALARHLRHLADGVELVVLGLPRGGVPVASEIARDLNAPLDVFVVRKLGFPGHEEFAIGAIASGGVRVLNEDLTSWYDLPDEVVEAVTRKERAELERRERAYREGRAPLNVKGRVVILVDDGLATGSTMKAAVRAVRQLDPARVVVAVPVCAAETCEALKQIADEVVCPYSPEPFRAVGLWYQDFSETSDAEVTEVLHSVEAAPGV